MNKTKFIELMEIETYDWAIPKQFFDSITEHAEENLSGHIVWCYDNDRAGYPVAVTKKGARFLGTYSLKVPTMEGPLPY